MILWKRVREILELVEGVNPEALTGLGQYMDALMESLSASGK